MNRAHLFTAVKTAEYESARQKELLFWQVKIALSFLPEKGGSEKVFALVESEIEYIHATDGVYGLSAGFMQACDEVILPILLESMWDESHYWYLHRSGWPERGTGLFYSRFGGNLQ